MAWYVNLNGQTMGPVDEAQVVDWIRSGHLLSGVVCAAGSQRWIDLTAHPIFAAALLKAAPPPPPPGASSPVSVLTGLGAVMLLGGIAAIVYYLNMDVSIEVPTVGIFGGGRVNNIGLMMDRQNGLMIGGLCGALGFITLVVDQVVARTRRRSPAHAPRAVAQGPVGALGYAMLAVPLLSAVGLWVVRIVASYPNAILGAVVAAADVFVVGTVVGTSVMVAVEAHQLGAAKTETSPIKWFAGCLAMWLVVFPHYLAKRTAYGRRGLGMAGLVAALVFMGSTVPLFLVLSERAANVKQQLQFEQSEKDAKAAAHAATEARKKALGF